MITEEFGFDLVLSDIFNLKNATKSDLEKSKYWAGGSISEEGYYRIKNYLEIITAPVSINLINGVLATFAYGHPQLVSGLEEKVEQVIFANSDKLFREIDAILSSTKLNLHEYQTCLYLMKLPLSYVLIDSLSILYFRSERIFKESHFFGIKNLLPKLAEICPKDFEKWYHNTTREDLKVIFINTILNGGKALEYVIGDQNIHSTIPIIKVCYLLIKFNVGRLGFPFSKKTINEIVTEESLIEKEKLYFILYSFKHRFFGSNEGLEIKQIESDLQFFASNFDHLEENIIEEYVGHINDRILAKAIGYMGNFVRKKQLLSIILKKLKSYLDKDKILTIEDVLKADLHGSILIEINDGSIEEIEKSINQKYEEMNTPYFFYRKNELWNSGVSTMMYYLIIIFILYQNKDTSKINLYKKKFTEIRGKFYHPLAIQFDELLLQIN